MLLNQHQIAKLRTYILRLYPLEIQWRSHLDSCVRVFVCSVCAHVHLLIVVIVLIILQAAGGLCVVRKGGTLRVVLWAPETIFPQLVTFCRTDRNKETCYTDKKKKEDLNCADLCQHVKSRECQPCCQAQLTPPLVTTCCDGAVMYVCVWVCMPMCDKKKCL